MLKLLFYFFLNGCMFVFQSFTVGIVMQPEWRLFGPIGFWFHICQFEGIPADNLLFFKVVRCLSEFWSCLEEDLLRQLKKTIIIKGIWKHEFFCWTQSLNILDQSLPFLPQFLHLDYRNVIQYRNGVIGQKFELEGAGKSFNLFLKDAYLKLHLCKQKLFKMYILKKHQKNI